MFCETWLHISSKQSVGLRASMKLIVTEKKSEWSWGLAAQSGGGAPGCDRACDVAPSVNWGQPPCGTHMHITVFVDKAWGLSGLWRVLGVVTMQCM